MEQKYIEEKMHELEKIINYKFNDINLLCEALKAKKIVGIVFKSKKHKEYSNDKLALVGDTILKFVLAEYLYKDQSLKTKEDITNKKSKLESNKTLHKIFIGENWRRFAYNDDNFYDESPKENRVSCKQHNQYIEAIIAAIYYDSSFDNVKHWILYFLYPLLKKYSDICYNKEK